MTNRGCTWRDRTQNHIANAVIFNVGLTSFVRCARCALQHASRFILDLGDSGLNPCADTRGLAGAVSSSAAFQPMARPIIWGDPGQSFESDNLGGIDDDEKTRECRSLERLPWYSWQSWEVRGVSSTSES